MMFLSLLYLIIMLLVINVIGYRNNHENESITVGRVNKNVYTY